MYFSIRTLLKSQLFHLVTEEEFLTYIPLDSCILDKYQKDTLFIQQNEPCDAIGFILEGCVAMQHFTSSGEALTIRNFKAKESFGAALLYAQDSFHPFSLVSKESTTILYVPFEGIKRLLKNHPQFNENFMRFLSNQITVFKEKIEILHQKDVRSRIILYLCIQYEKNKKLCFTLPHRKTEIAALIGVARPSVSREFAHMESDGLIQLEGSTITLVKPHFFTPHQK